MRNHLARTLFAAALAAGALSCVERNADIDRVDVDKQYWDRTQFGCKAGETNCHGSWYMRRTVIDAPYENAWVQVGNGDWATLDKVRWEIRENAIIAWRTYEYTANTEGQDDPGADFKSAPAAAFPILAHFDKRKDYNPSTGEEMNTWSENYEKPWYQRQFMRIDWSSNIAPTLDLLVGAQSYSSGGFTVPITEVSSPDRMRITSDQIDFVNHWFIVPDWYSCWYLFERFYMQCNASTVKVRTSFEKVQASDYQPLYYPDYLTARDESGNIVKDADGNAIQIPMHARFGYYRLEKVTYDNERELTETGRLYRAMRWNIWKKNLGPDGKPVPYAQREVKQIVYHTNVGFPDYLIGAAQKVTGGWNKAFKETVNELKYGGARSLDAVEDVVVLKPNDCNEVQVNQVIEQRGLAGAVEKELGEKVVTPANLERACSTLEYLTNGEFTWQRVGDIKYNMMVWTTKPVQVGWAGLGPMLGDPETAEIVHSVFYMNGAYFETAASGIADQILAWQKAISTNDVINATLVRRQITANMNERNRSGGVDQASKEFMDELERRFQGLPEGQGQPIKKADPSGPESKLHKIAGTKFEKELFLDQNTLLVQNYGRWTPKTPPTADVYEKAALQNWLTPEAHRAKAERDRYFGERTVCMTSFSDNAIAGVAVEMLKYNDGDIDTRWNKIRQEILQKMFYGVALHEMGHNMGLRHNFEGSYDPLNFPDAFWQAEELPDAITDPDSDGPKIGALAVPGLSQRPGVLDKLDKCLQFYVANQDKGALMPTTQQCLGADESMFSTTMEYMPRWNSDFGGLGHYDHAAIKFAYGNLVELFDPAVAMPTVPAGQKLPDLINEADYHKFNDPGAGYFANAGCESTLSCSAGIKNRKYKVVNFGNGFGERPVSRDAREVPYRFCAEEYRDFRLTCQVWDIGASPKEVVDNTISMYKNYFFFKNFIRDRYLWDVNAVINGSYGTFARMTLAFQNFYYLRAKRGAGFMDTFYGKNLAAATAQGLNFIQEVLGMPNPGKHCLVNDFYIAGPEYVPESTVLNVIKYNYADTLEQWGVSPSVIDSITSCEQIPTGPIPGRECNPPRTESNCERDPRNGQLRPFNIARDIFGTMGWDGKWKVTDIPLGVGRPFGLNFTDDFVDYRIASIGSYWDKLYAMVALTDTYAYFDRMSNADLRAYSIGYYKLFKPELTKLFGDIITRKTQRFSPVVTEDSSGVPLGYSPRLFVDATTVNNGLTPVTAGVPIMPTFSENLSYYAILLGQIYLTSVQDSSLDFNKYTRIGLKGSYDDFSAFDAAPPDQRIEFTHPVSRQTYRAMKTPAERMTDYLYVPGANLPLSVARGDTLVITGDTAPVSRNGSYTVFRRIDDHRVQLDQILPGGEQNAVSSIAVTGKMTAVSGPTSAYADGVSIAFDMLQELRLYHGYWQDSKMCADNMTLPVLQNPGCDPDHPSDVNPADPTGRRVCLSANEDSRCASCVNYTWSAQSGWDCQGWAADTTADRRSLLENYDEQLNSRMELVENIREFQYFVEFGQ